MESEGLENDLIKNPSSEPLLASLGNFVEKHPIQAYFENPNNVDILPMSSIQHQNVTIRKNNTSHFLLEFRRLEENRLMPLTQKISGPILQANPLVRGLDVNPMI